MSRNRRWLCCPTILTVCIACIGVASVFAESIVVENASFEEPILGDPWYTPSGLPADGAWKNSGSFAGIFVNGHFSDTLTNANGNQMAFMDTATGAQVWQDLSAVYEVGKSYTLSVGVAGRSDVPGNSVDELSLRLFYRDKTNPDVAYPIAQTPVARGGLSTTMLTYYTVTVPTVQASDDYSGQAIGIWFFNTVKGANPGSFTLDNVSVLAVPEPCAIALLASGTLGLVCCAWRKRTSR